MRGKGGKSADGVTAKRITPAYAGKRISALSSIGVPRDHPRLCGEKAASYCAKRFVVGSPPPMRGKAFGKICNDLFNGITPAYAGKSRLFEIVNVNHEDHPRLCGEKLETRHDFTEKLGSPPPMRGKGKSSWRDN